MGDAIAFWWVNQGQSYTAERQASILWAPLRTDAGYDLVHWSSMTKVVSGDVIFNYAAGHLRAVSVAFGPEELAVRPVDLPSQWPSDGRLIRVEMTDIVPPIPLVDHSRGWAPRRAECWSLRSPRHG